MTPADELADLKERYLKGGIGYKESKDILVKNTIAFIKPMREKRDELAKNKDKVLEIIKKGGEVARARAEKKMDMVRERVGISLK